MSATLWFLFAFYPENEDMLNRIDNSFFAALAIVTAIGFLYYGVSLYRMLSGYGDECDDIMSSVTLTGDRLMKGRRGKLVEVALQTASFTISFLVRASALIVGEFTGGLADDYIVLLAYFTIVEIIPCALVLFTLRKIPSGASAGSQVRGSTGGGGSVSNTGTPSSQGGGPACVSGTYTVSSPLAATGQWYAKNSTPSAPAYNYGVSYGYGSFAPSPSLARTRLGTSPAPLQPNALSQSYARNGLGGGGSMNVIPRANSMTGIESAPVPVNINSSIHETGTSVPSSSPIAIATSPMGMGHPALGSSYHESSIRPPRGLYPTFGTNDEYSGQ